LKLALGRENSGDAAINTQVGFVEGVIPGKGNVVQMVAVPRAELSTRADFAGRFGVVHGHLIGHG
jgi:hypothetical protein